jgi:hypothetical protein
MLMTRTSAAARAARVEPAAVERARLELALVVLAAALLTILFTYPIAFKMGSVGRVDNGDGQLSIWNVAWVARTLVADPRHVFDANIFYPHTGTLTYSESNLGAGALAIPVYWATRNPYAAHNAVALFAFAAAFVSMYLLVRHLTDDWRAAAVSGLWFAFCPMIFTRLAHIQLLMTAGLPLAMLAIHRVADRPTPGRGAALGAAMAAQALCCGYYGIFAILMVGFAIVVLASTRRLWTSRAYWRAIAIGAVLSILLVAPAFVPYLHFQNSSGFHRTVGEAVRYSANWSAYLASPAFAHAWLLDHLPRWSDVLFPGVLVTTFGVAGVVVSWRERKGELALLYGGMGVLALWLSFGPTAGLYALLYKLVPLFAWLRVPSRFGLVVVFALSVLGGVAMSSWLRRSTRPAVAFASLAALACAELVSPLRMPEVPPVSRVYTILKTLPPGPVIEMPFWYLEPNFPRHSYYMLQSTMHWMPLVNGYSDYIPDDFRENVMRYAIFPAPETLKSLQPIKVRYAVFHRDGFNAANWRDVQMRIEQATPYLRELYADEATRLYEVVAFPP